MGYAPGAYDLFHIGHLNLLRQAKEHCDILIAGVVADEVLIQYKGGEARFAGFGVEVPYGRLTSSSALC
ncbi:adenylyltransferase/cytidyltransferase family protein [Cupriavidus sp. CuC1]|uniref:adenylyltransferase/cytidyltransferase family protein n=1 Tax=Cupriavidus sp. CuC1 TaxID=3373131 RepID=UPI0037D4C075